MIQLLEKRPGPGLIDRPARKRRIVSELPPPPKPGEDIPKIPPSNPDLGKEGLPPRQPEPPRPQPQPPTPGHPPGPPGQEGIH